MSKIYPRCVISSEYDAAAKQTEEYQMVKWGSSDKMTSRFDMAVQLLPFSEASHWLDIGSGTGAFQEKVLKLFPPIQAVAIDLSQELIRYAKEKPGLKNVRFIHGDLMEFSGGQFDIITSIGVLQKTTFTLQEFFRKCIFLLREGGVLFVDTKHGGWNKFMQGELTPDVDIEWFSVEELTASATHSGFIVETVAGFLPGTSELVAPEESHTIFLIARKQADDY